MTVAVARQHIMSGLHFTMVVLTHGLEEKGEETGVPQLPLRAWLRWHKGLSPRLYLFSIFPNYHPGKQVFLII